MAITFDGATKRIILDSAAVSAAEIWSRWCDWQDANPQWPMAFRQVGGDSLGGGLYIPPYFFLSNGWRVRPMESSHTLIITGNLFVEGGGVPVVQTLGTYNVSVQYTVPVQAQGISTGGGTLTAADVWSYILEGSLSASSIQRLTLAALLNKLTDDNGEIRIRDLADTKDRAIVLTDQNGQRLSHTLDGD